MFLHSMLKERLALLLTSPFLFVFTFYPLLFIAAIESTSDVNSATSNNNNSNNADHQPKISLTKSTKKLVKSEPTNSKTTRYFICVLFYCWWQFPQWTRLSISSSHCACRATSMYPYLLFLLFLPLFFAAPMATSLTCLATAPCQRSTTPAQRARPQTVRAQ